jgi:hypothetical protein
VATPLSRRRDDANSSRPAAINRPSFQGNTKFCPGPRKNEPIITSTAHDIRNIVNSEMANLRSSGLLEGLRSV